MYIHPSLTNVIADPTANFPVRYASVTRVLSEIADKSGLLAWRARVGDAEADRISKESTTFGTLLHDHIERYIIDPSTRFDDIAPGRLKFTIDNWLSKVRRKDIIPLLIEVPMQSHVMKLQGIPDMIALIDGVLTVVDWKTSKNMKPRKYIQDYFKQASAYALMYKEMFGETPKELNIVICGDMFCQWETDKLSNWVQPLQESVHEYYHKMETHPSDFHRKYGHYVTDIQSLS